MDLSAWLKTYLAQHPVKGLPAHDAARYTQDVMARVRASQAPQPVRAPAWSWWPSLGLLASAAVVLLVIGVTAQRSPTQLVERVAEDAALLAALDEPYNGAVGALADELLVDEVEALTPFVLAEAPAESEDDWLQETMDLLDELDQEMPAADDTPTDDEDWLKELEQVDEAELSART